MWKAYKEEKVKTSLAIQQFYAGKQMTSYEQPMPFNKADFTACSPQIAQFADRFIRFINHDINNKSCFSWKKNIRTFHYQFKSVPQISKDWWDSQVIATDALKTLKDLGYIFSYSIAGNNKEFWIIC